MLRILVMLLLVTGCLRAEDVRMYLRSDGGYDFFDFAGTLMSYSVPNEKGSYDFFDRTGVRIGWAESRDGGRRIEFFDAAGSQYRVIERAVDGAQAVSNALGRLYNLSAPNALGGVDNYDPKGMLTSYTTNGDYVVVRPDAPE